MERIDPDQVLPLLRIEHQHRYLWAARHARGHVLDAACGVGYGAPILTASAAVTAYCGIDLSDEAISSAKKNYAAANRTFAVGNVYTLPVATGSIDTVVSLETIEHLDHAELALREFARVLKPDGLLLASVPLDVFETLCTEAYGPNEFHKARFSRESLRDLVCRVFATMRVWDCWLQIASVLAPVDGAAGAFELESDATINPPLGSLLFAASKSGAAALPADHATRILPAMVVAEHEKLTLSPRLEVIRRQTEMIDERDTLIRSLEGKLAARREENTAQAHLIDQKDAFIKDLESRLAARREENQAQARLVDERDAEIRRQAAVLTAMSADLASAKSAAEQTRSELQALQTQAGTLTAHHTNVVSERDALAASLQRSHEQLTVLQARADETAVAMQASLAAEREAAGALRTALTREHERVSELTSELAAARALATSHESAIRDHQTLVTAQAELLEKRNDFIKHLDTLIKARDESLIAQTQLISERDTLIQEQDALVQDRDAAIEQQTRLITERDSLIAEQDRLVAARDAELAVLSRTVESTQAALDDAHAYVRSLESTITSNALTIRMLEQRVESLGGSLSMVRHEFRRHLQDLGNPTFLIKQTTRAILGLAARPSSDDLET